MKSSKLFILMVFFVAFTTNTSAASEKSGINSQKLDLTVTQQLEI
ncbi:MAG: hypothetical protein AAF383_07715 [Cyanobacteria bacterium P01_A01_bin.83]